MQKPFLKAVLLATCVVHGAYAQVDLNNLRNYANQFVPSYITKDNTPVNNPISDAGATLGRVLFYDSHLSSNSSVSCASCHQQQKAFSDQDARSEGIDGNLTDRHSMRLVNARFGEEEKFRWDESASSLEEQMTLPIRKATEMGFSGDNGNPGFNDLIARMKTLPYYKALFKRAFGTQEITEQKMQYALAQFVRSIQSFDTKYDQGRAMVNSDLEDFPNFTADENAGKRLFIEDYEWEVDQITVDPVGGNPGGTFDAAHRISGGLNCATCHGGPEFDIDEDSLNNGFVRASPPGPGAPLDTEVFRSPTLRDMINPDGTLNGGMFHSGLATNLNLIFAHYDFRRLDPDNPNLDPRMTRDGLPQWLDVTQQERQQIFAFLRTLTGSDVYTNEKWSDPFDGLGLLTVFGLECDFENNGDCELVDVDMLTSAIASGSTANRV